jgi:hypothetical protein
VVGQPDQLEQLLDPLVCLTSTPVLQSKRDVFSDREVGKERVILKHETDIPAIGRHEPVWRRNRVAGDPDLAGGRLLKSGNQPECRRLPTARRPQQREQFSILDRQREVLDGCLGTVRAGHAVEL